MSYNFTEPYIIAEIGSNYRRHYTDEENLQNAKMHVYHASDCWADAVKFQFFNHQDLYGPQWKGMGTSTIGSIGEKQRNGTRYIRPEWLLELSSYADSLALDFMCSAFSVEGYELVDPVVNIHKLASCEMKHIPIVRYLASTKKPVIISTAGHTQKDVDLVLNEFAKINPSVTTTVTLLQCVGAYPAYGNEYNLSVLNKWKDNFRVGVSDHTLTDTVAIASVGFGATVFEKHLDAFKHGTLVETEDWPASISADEFIKYTSHIEQAFSAIGKGDKAPTVSECEMVDKWHRRLIVTKPIKQGDIFRYQENFGIYRSQTVSHNYLQPEFYEKVDGLTATRDYEPGETIESATVI